MIITNSILEFAILGPNQGRDSVLVRSGNADILMLGFALAAREEEGAKQHRDHSTLPFPFSTDSDQLNVVTSRSFDDLSPSNDSRKSTYKFAWKGYCFNDQLYQIAKGFNASLPDIVQAVKNDDDQRVSLAIAPLVFECVSANKKRLRSRRIIQLGLWFYLAAAAVGGLVLMIQKISSH